MSPTPEPVIVGRDAEHRVVRDALKGLGARRSTTIEVTGEAGIGKTSLVDAAVRLAAAQGTAIVRGRASQLERDLPYGLWIDALGDADALEEQPGTPELRHRLHRRMRAVVAGRSTGRGVLVALDDLHWADEASIDLIASIIERGLDAPTVLLLSYRPHQAGTRVQPDRLRAAPRHALRTLPLRPLPISALGALLPADLDDAQRARIVAQCGGNPLLLRALVHRDERAGHPDPSVGVPAITGDLVAAAPRSSEPTVQSAIASELDPLSVPARRLLEAAAIAGDPFSLDLAEAIAGLSDHVVDALDEIAAADLIRPGAAPRWFGFRHPLLHAAVLDGIPAGRRGAAHARAAEALGAAGEAASLLAPHVERSARPGDAEAIAVLRRAGLGARGRAPASAAHWLTAAWALVPGDARHDWPSLKLMTETVTALSIAGRQAEARSMLVDLLDGLPAGHSARHPAIIGCALVERFMNRAGSARVRLAAALQACSPGPSWERAQLLVELGMLEASEDEPARLAVHGVELLPCAAALDAAPLAATAMAFEALAAALLEPAGVATERVLRAHAAVQAFDDQIFSAAVRASCVTAEAAVLIRRNDLALPLLERAVLASQNGADFIATTEAMAGHALVLAALGRARAATETAEAALEEARLMTNELSLLAAQLATSVAIELSGDAHAAVVAAQQAELHVTRTGTRMARSFVGQALGRALIAAERPREAAEALLRLHGGDELPLVPPGLRAESCALLASAALAEAESAGVSDAARHADLLAAARRWADRAHAASAEGFPGDDAFAWQASAEIALAAGHYADARDHAEHAAAAAAAADAGLPVVAGRARVLAGRALALAGDRDGAATVLREAEATFVRCGADRLAADAVRELRAIGRRVSRRGRAGVTTGPAVLTARQRQVAELAASGLSNRQIAERLYLSPKTIETHLAAAFTALGVASRTALAAALVAASP